MVLDGARWHLSSVNQITNCKTTVLDLKTFKTFLEAKPELARPRPRGQDVHEVTSRILDVSTTTLLSATVTVTNHFSSWPRKNNTNTSWQMDGLLPGRLVLSAAAFLFLICEIAVYV